jgi:hypothetical protein
MFSFSNIIRNPESVFIKSSRLMPSITKDHEDGAPVRDEVPNDGPIVEIADENDVLSDTTFNLQTATKAELYDRARKLWRKRKVLVDKLAALEEEYQEKKAKIDEIQYLLDAELDKYYLEKKQAEEAKRN